MKSKPRLRLSRCVLTNYHVTVYTDLATQVGSPASEISTRKSAAAIVTVVAYAQTAGDLGCGMGGGGKEAVLLLL